MPLADKSLSASVRSEASERLAITLKLYARNTTGFIKDFGWAPDPREMFGSRQIPEGMSPKGSVPLLLFPKQRALIEEWDAILDSEDPKDFWMDKCRQVAATTFFLWWGLHKWFFRSSTYGLMTTYDKDLVDSGGKGQRETNSLFGRLRFFIDAFMWSLSLPAGDGNRQSYAKFNQHKLPTPNQKMSLAKRRALLMDLVGMDESDDVGFKLTRPRWIVGGVPICPGAEGNTLIGDVAGDAFGRSQTGTWSLNDEFPHYNANYGAGTDRATHSASVSNTKMRVFMGTPPREGGTGTMMYEVVTKPSEDANTVVRHFDWTDMPVYLMGGHWECPDCGHANEWDFRVSPGDDGIKTPCRGCLVVQRVTRFILTSKWFRDTCARMLHDKIGIAAEVQRDWGGVIGDRLFASWHESTGVRPYAEPKRIYELDGYDPGFSIANPAAWVAGVFDRDRKSIQLVGYWMASDAYIEYFVPFFKRWTPEQVRRLQVGGGQFTGQTFMDAFQYSDGALAMMERMHRFRKPGTRCYHRERPVYGGDKYGSHTGQTESPYDLLSRKWRVDFEWEYTSDREILVRRGQEFAARMTIDEEIADIQPETGLGKSYPSLREVFLGAKPKPHGGHAEYRLDVDKQEPPHVNNACDAWFYLVRLLTGDVIGVMDSSGQFGYEDDEDEAWDDLYWEGEAV